MPDEVAFLRTILDHPDEDGPRLVYADWLEETGETARAEFIRVQLELARQPTAELRQRAEALLKRYKLRWQRRVGSWVRDAEFHRGLMEFARVRGASFVRCGMRLFERAAVMRVRLTEASPHLSRIATCPGLPWIRELDIGYNGLVASNLLPLINTPQRLQLRSLDLSANRLLDQGVSMLVRWSNLRSLKRLLLPRNGLTARGLRELGRGEWPELSELDIGGNSIGAEGLAALLETPLARQLQMLSLANTNIGDAGAALLADSPAVTHLIDLNLAATGLGDEGIAALANSPRLAALERLDLSYNPISPAAAEALATSRYLDDVRCLILAGSRVGRAGVALLQRRFGDRVRGI